MPDRDELQTVADIARRAGEIALRHYRKVAGERKGDESFVTVADREVERFIRAELGRAFPGEMLVGEEQGRLGDIDGDRVWFIDPIDGTANFVHGIPFWCVAIGLLQGGLPQLGVVYHPLLRETYAAERGRGAWRNDQPLSVWTADEPFSRTDPVTLSPSMIRRGVSFPAPVRIRSMGSSQLHFTMVAAGSARAGVWTNDYGWDLVAGVALVEAAGGVVTTFRGDAPEYGRLVDGSTQPWGLVGCGPASHAAMLQALAPVVEASA